MNKLRLTILKPGMQTTIQDHGREAFRAYGVPKSGPMDVGSAHLANQLVGNSISNPVMEFTLIGPAIELEGTGYLCLTGGQFDVSLGQSLLSMDEVIPIEGRHKLTIGRVRHGCRGYLAISGSWDLQPWLGSCSTYRDLAPDSMIKKGMSFTVSGREQSFPESPDPSKTYDTTSIRILAGPEYHRFKTANIRELLGKPFVVSPQSNRMGYRLSNPLSDYDAPLEIISSGVVPGTIQVTHQGQLIVLMADAQTTGGYPRLAHVISADLDKLAQMKPGDDFRFRLVSLKEAYEVL